MNNRARDAQCHLPHAHITDGRAPSRTSRDAILQSHLDLVEYVPATDTTEATVKRQHSVGVVAYPGGSEGPPAVIQYSNAKTGDALSILLHLRDDRSSAFHH